MLPGTYGVIPINIEATGSETFLEYTINISTNNKPENLKFYYDAEQTQEINLDVINEEKGIYKYTRRGFLTFKDNILEREENIYWTWLLESGSTEEEINSNDILDSKWMDKSMTMTINVTGVQVQKEPMYYSAKYGDMINYTPKGKETIQGVVVNKIADIVEIMPVKQNENGLYKAVTSGEETIEITNISGYKNAIKDLNNLAISTYKEAKASRALKVEDVNNLTGYIPQNLITSKRYTSGTFIVDKLIKINDTIDATSLGLKIGETVTINQIIGNTNIESVTINCTKDVNTNEYYKYNLNLDYFDRCCWLASYGIVLYSNEYCGFRVRCIYPDSGRYYIDAFLSYNSDGGMGNANCPVIPVISLLSSFNAKYDTENNQWNVY